MQKNTNASDEHAGRVQIATSAQLVANTKTGTTGARLVVPCDLFTPGGMGGAPASATFITINNEASLSDERKLTGTTNQVNLTDNGANSTLVLSTPQDIHTGASPTFNSLTLTTDLTVANGGTGASTAVDARNNLGDLEFDAVVAASNGDYTTIKAAVDAGFHRILVASNTTEAANISLDSSVHPTFFFYIVADATVTMGTSRFTVADVADLTVYVRGQGTIDYTHTAANQELFDVDWGTNLVDIEGISIVNNSSASGCLVVEEDVRVRIHNCDITLPNQDKAGLWLREDNSQISNVRFIGGGTSCKRALYIDSQVPVTASNLIFNGTFTPSSTTASDAVIEISEINSLNDTRLENLTNAIRINVGANAQVFNLRADTGVQDVDIYITGNGAQLTNIWLDGGNIDLQAQTDTQITNLYGAGNSIDFTDASQSGAILTNCYINDAVTFGGDKNKINNCIFIGGVTVNSGADDNGFTNCQFGSNVGGGAGTITVNAGSNRTRIAGCMSDAAISDAGTGTVTAANTVY